MLQENRADVVALSALMTTRVVAMPRAIEMLKAVNPEVIVLVGGAPLNTEIAQSYGADGYAPDAIAAVESATRLIAKAA